MVVLAQSLEVLTILEGLLSFWKGDGGGGWHKMFYAVLRGQGKMFQTSIFPFRSSPLPIPVINDQSLKEFLTFGAI